jgi:hypothetical protein
MENSYSGSEQVESEISLDKLKAGDIIEVTYASDNETVAKVVKQPGTQGFRRVGAPAEAQIGGSDGPAEVWMLDGIGVEIQGNGDGGAVRIIGGGIAE